MCNSIKSFMKSSLKIFSLRIVPRNTCMIDIRQYTTYLYTYIAYAMHFTSSITSNKLHKIPHQLHIFTRRLYSTRMGFIQFGIGTCALTLVYQLRFTYASVCALTLSSSVHIITCVLTLQKLTISCGNMARMRAPRTTSNLINHEIRRVMKISHCIRLLRSNVYYRFTDIN